MYRISLALAIAACVVFTNSASAQAPVSWFDKTWPKTSTSEGYVTVMGKIDVTKVKIKKVTGVAVANGYQEYIGGPTDLIFDKVTGVFGGEKGWDLKGAAGTYNNGDVLTIVIIVYDDTNRPYYLVGSAASYKK